MLRRSFLTMAATGAAATLAPWSLRRAAARDTVRVAASQALSGPFAAVGQLSADGAKLGCEVMSAKLPFNLAFHATDDGGDPGRSVRVVQEEAGQHQTRFFLGTTNSATALAISKTVAQEGGVYINQSGADEVTGSACNKSNFRWPVATYGCIRETVAPLVKANPNLKRWYTITGQYVFGESLLNNTKTVLAELGCEHVGNSYHAIAETEFSGYVSNAMAAQPDVLCILNFGGATIQAVREAVSFGLKQQMTIVVPWANGLDQFQGWGADTFDGVYAGIQYWHDVDTPGNREYRAAYAKVASDAPNFLHASGYAIAQMLGEGMLKAGSSDWQAVIAAMEGHEYEGLTGKETIRAGDHQVIKDFYLVRGKPADKMRDAYDFADIVSQGKTAPDLAATGCKL